MLGKLGIIGAVQFILCAMPAWSSEPTDIAAIPESEKIQVVEKQIGKLLKDKPDLQLVKGSVEIRQLAYEAYFRVMKYAMGVSQDSTIEKVYFRIAKKQPGQDVPEMLEGRLFLSVSRTIERSMNCGLDRMGKVVCEDSGCSNAATIQPCQKVCALQNGTEVPIRVIDAPIPGHPGERRFIEMDVCAALHPDIPRTYKEMVLNFLHPNALEWPVVIFEALTPIGYSPGLTLSEGQ